MVGANLPFASTYHVLYWVAVESDHTNGGCPLMVFLVDFLIEFGVV